MYRGVAGILILVAVLTIPFLLSSRSSLGEEEATQLIRHYLKYQSSQRHAERYRSGTIDAEASKRFQEELGQIDKLQFTSVDIGRLFPDYVLGRRPTFHARVVIRDDRGQLQTRYFNLGGGHLVIGESSRFAWMFVL